MTAQEMITKFREMVGGYGLDSDYELQLVNDAINEVESMKDWLVLTKEQSYVITQGQSYQDTQSLPTRFANDIKVIEDDDLQYKKYDFVDRYSKVNASNGYFLDLANDKIGFVGQNLPSVTVYLYYTQYSADLGLTDTWVFPARFHTIVPYQMAELYYPSDQSERGRSWDDKWREKFDMIFARMSAWDDRLRTRNRTSRAYFKREDSLNLPPLVR